MTTFVNLVPVVGSSQNGTRTVVGDVRVTVAPSPSWPEEFAPQHATAPELVIPQAWLSPVDCFVSRTPVSVATVTGTVAMADEPTPNWPEVSLPQQYVIPPGSRPHVCHDPAAMVANTRPSAIRPGVVRDVLVPSPNWP